MKSTSIVRSLFALFLLSTTTFCTGKPIRSEPQTGTSSGELSSTGNEEIQEVVLEGMEIPKSQKGETKYQKEGYTLAFDEERKLAAWAAYELTKDKAESEKADRKLVYTMDPEIRGGTARPEDFNNSNYEKSQLVPASDMQWSNKAAAQTYQMSNIVPQSPSLNRGLWKRLEERVHAWASQYGRIFVVSGPIYHKAEVKLRGMTVPTHFFKVILDAEEPGIKAIAFILPQNYRSQDVRDYVVSVDTVEKVTGLDFFSQLPDATEEAVEQHSDFSQWIIEETSPSESNH